MSILQLLNFFQQWTTMSVPVHNRHWNESKANSGPERGLSTSESDPSLNECLVETWPYGHLLPPEAYFSEQDTADPLSLSTVFLANYTVKYYNGTDPLKHKLRFIEYDLGII